MSGNQIDSALIGAIYEQGLVQGAWKPALERLRALANSAETALVEHETSLSAVTAMNVISQQSYEAYSNYFLLFDPKRPLFETAGPGFLFNDAEHFDDAFIARDRFYQEFSIPHGMRYTLDLFAGRRGTREVYVAAMRPKRQGPFAPRDAARIRAAGNHFFRALNLRRQLEETQALARHAAAALDHLSYGVMVVDDGLRVLLANRSARRIVDAGGELRFRAARLSARSGPTDRALDATVRRAISETAPASVLRLPRADGPDLHLWCIGLPETSPLAQSGKSCALLLFRDPDVLSLPSPGLLQTIYNLTDAEARLALAIAGGRTLAAHAKKRNIRLSTARTQFLAVLAKMNLHRQADVARTIAVLSNPASG